MTKRNVSTSPQTSCTEVGANKAIEAGFGASSLNMAWLWHMECAENVNTEVASVTNTPGLSSILAASSTTANCLLANHVLNSRLARHLEYPVSRNPERYFWWLYGRHVAPSSEPVRG